MSPRGRQKKPAGTKENTTKEEKANKEEAEKLERQVEEKFEPGQQKRRPKAINLKAIDQMIGQHQHDRIDEEQK